MSSITRQGVRLKFKNNYEIHGVNDEKLVYYYNFFKTFN